MSDAASINDRITTAQEAEHALKYLDDAFRHVTASYMQRLTQIAASEPWEARKMTNVAMAASIAEQARQWIEAIARDGEVAMADLKRLNKIESMSDARKRVLGIGLGRR